MRERVRIGILGASGYTGAELLRLLGDHPRAEIRALTAERQAGKPIGEVFPQLAVYDLPTSVKIEDVDVARAGRRLLLPAACDDAGDHQGAAARAQGGRPVGRLPAARPAALRAHLRPPASGAGAAGAGGLRADRALSRRDPRAAGWSPIRAASPTAAELPLVPLLKERLIQPDGIIIDAKSGVSGAGPRRQAGQPVHRGRRGHPRLWRGHAPAHARDRAVPRRFRRPADAGHLHAASDADEPRHPGDDLCPARGRRRRPRTCTPASAGAYAGEPFVHVLPFKTMPATRHVRGTNLCLIGVHPSRIPGEAILVSVHRQSGQGRLRARRSRT